MFYWYAETMQRPEGKVLPRRGALHWSDAYAVMPAQNGSVMVTPAPDFDTQFNVPIEEGVHEDLIDPKYQEPETQLYASNARRKFCAPAGKDARELFL